MESVGTLLMTAPLSNAVKQPEVLRYAPAVIAAYAHVAAVAFAVNTSSRHSPQAPCLGVYSTSAQGNGSSPLPGTGRTPVIRNLGDLDLGDLDLGRFLGIKSDLDLGRFLLSY